MTSQPGKPDVSLDLTDGKLTFTIWVDEFGTEYAYDVHELLLKRLFSELEYGDHEADILHTEAALLEMARLARTSVTHRDREYERLHEILFKQDATATCDIPKR